MRTKFYSRASILDFGLYKSYELGAIYVVDPKYIIWCIQNINWFCVVDLDILERNGVVKDNLDWHYRMIGDPSLITELEVYNTYSEFLQNCRMHSFTLPDEIKQLNKSKLI